MIKLTVSEFTFMLMEHDMKACGKMISSMEEVKRAGLIIAFTSVNTSTVKSMVEANTAGLMGASMMENGSKIKLKVLAHTPGLMEENTMDNG
jgi:hypothetical protein